MKLSHEDRGPVTVVTISGGLTAEHADAFRRTCQDRLTAGRRDLIFDMEYVTVVDSAGLELLLWLNESVAECKGRLRLVTPDGTVRKILEITRLDRHFDLHDSIGSADGSLRANREVA